MTTPLPTRIDRYEVVNRLGRGGMGEVYLATDPALGRTVAIKVLTEDNGELRERFAREARSAAALKHNNIVTIYDVGEDKGRPFIAMEYLDGETMAEMIKRRASVRLARKVELMMELCAGLGYAHRGGIIHRDIKPANLMITAEGSLKILDFGIARVKEDATSSGLTSVGMVIGSTHYMSPEQAEGLPVDERSDIFAVGSVLYELLAGERAFGGDNAQVVLNKILNREPRPIRELCPDLDPELERIVNKGLTKDLATRYQTLAAMATDLGRVLERHKYLGEATVPIERGSRPAPVDDVPTHTPTPAFRGALDAKEIARRRAAQIQSHLDEASGHFKAGRYEQAIELSEKALVINPEESRALQLLQLTHRALEARQIRLWLDEADALKAEGSLTGAERLVAQALQLQPDSLDAQASLLDLRERRRARELLAERARAVRAAVAKGQGSLAVGAFEAAARSANEALAFDSEDPEARQLLLQATAGIDERSRREAHDRRAEDVIAAANLQANLENPQAPVDLLRSFWPPHERVTRALADIEQAGAVRAAARREAERLEHLRLEQALEKAPSRFKAGVDHEPTSETRAWPPAETSERTPLAPEQVPGGRAEEATLVRVPGQARESAVTAGAAASAVDLSRVPTHRGGLFAAVAALIIVTIGGLAYVGFSDSGKPTGDSLEVRVRTVVRSADALWTQGKQQEAIDLLQTFQPSHSDVNVALARLLASRVPTGGGQPKGGESTGNESKNKDQDNERRLRGGEQIRQSQRALASGQLVEALDRAVEAARLGLDSTQAVNAVIEAAARRATEARESAVKTGASSVPPFKTAEAAESDARRLRTSNPTTALSKYLTAEREYRKATDDHLGALSNEDLANTQLAQWVTTTLTQAREFSNLGRSAEALSQYRLIKQRAPLTPGIDGMIAEEDKRRIARDLQLWASAKLADVDRAIGSKQWDEAGRLLAELRERAAATEGLDARSGLIERGRADAIKKPVEPLAKPTPTVSDRTAVEEVLDVYRTGYNKMSVQAMRRAWPSMSAGDEANFKRVFDQYSQQEWHLSDIQVVITSNGASATGQLRLARLLKRDKGKKPTEENYLATITLQKKQAGWEIVAVKLDRKPPRH